MNPFADLGDQLIYNCDALDGLRALPAESVHCAVSSPPYFSQRRYLPANHPDADKMIGLEPEVEIYLTRLVEIFREVRRVLRKDGTLFLNLGDSYYGSGHGPTGKNGIGDQLVRQGFVDRSHVLARDNDDTKKPKGLIGLPWRVAFALQADGWYLRKEIIWSKIAPMPESVTDRPTTAHEYIFLMSKSACPQFWTHRDLPGAVTPPRPDYRWRDNLLNVELTEPPAGWKTMLMPDEQSKRFCRFNLWRGHNYYYDRFAIREPLADSTIDRYERGWNGNEHRAYPAGWQNHMRGFMADDEAKQQSIMLGANLTTVWTFNTAHTEHTGLNEHYATFPQELPRRCILLGTSENGCCPKCGAGWQRAIETIPGVPDLQEGLNQRKRNQGASSGGWARSTLSTGSPALRFYLDWRPGCDCDAGEAVPAVVLDPFLGSGTTLVVARREGRRGIGIDLSKQYCEAAVKRIERQPVRMAGL